MKVLIFGATGMVGQGVLRECLAAEDVTLTLAVGRGGTGRSHPGFRELILSDLTRLDDVETELSGFDACFFCLGVSAAGLSEAEYTRLTFDLTLAVAERLARLNPGMVFVYVSGQGTDSSEKGRVMWARVKGRTENALLRLPFGAVYLFRPGVIQPLDGIVSRTRAYRLLYLVAKPLLTPLRRLFPRRILTTRSVGRAMLEAARHGAPTPVLEAPDIAALGGQG